MVERLMRAIGCRGVAPPYAIAIDEDNPAQHAAVINARFAMGLREKGLKTRHLPIAQPKQIRHVHRHFCCDESRN